MWVENILYLQNITLEYLLEVLTFIEIVFSIQKLQGKIFNSHLENRTVADPFLYKGTIRGYYRYE